MRGIFYVNYPWWLFRGKTIGRDLILCCSSLVNIKKAAHDFSGMLGISRAVQVCGVFQVEGVDVPTGRGTHFFCFSGRSVSCGKQDGMGKPSLLLYQGLTDMR